MKKSVITLVVIFFSMLFCHSAFATGVTYELTGLGGSSYEYVYTIENDTLQVAIEQFTIWFEEDLYENLQITTPSPLTTNWDEIILPSTGFGIPLGYDGLTLADGIDIGETVGGFSVSFDWLGPELELPANQPFHIVDPANSQTIDSGFTTVPEPMTFLLLSLGGLVLRRR